MNSETQGNNKVQRSTWVVKHKGITKVGGSHGQQNIRE
jgi:hypothetical protein